MSTQLLIPIDQHDAAEKELLIDQFRKTFRMQLDEDLLRRMPNDRLQYIIDWKKAFDKGGIEALRDQQLLPGQRRDRLSYSDEAAVLEKQVFKFSFKELFNKTTH